MKSLENLHKGHYREAFRGKTLIEKSSIAAS